MEQCCTIGVKHYIIFALQMKIQHDPSFTSSFLQHDFFPKMCYDRNSINGNKRQLSRQQHSSHTKKHSKIGLSSSYSSLFVVYSKIAYVCFSWFSFWPTFVSDIFQFQKNLLRTKKAAKKCHEKINWSQCILVKKDLGQNGWWWWRSIIVIRSENPKSFYQRRGPFSLMR